MLTPLLKDDQNPVIIKIFDTSPKILILDILVHYAPKPCPKAGGSTRGMSANWLLLDGFQFQLLFFGIVKASCNLVRYIMRRFWVLAPLLSIRELQI